MTQNLALVPSTFCHHRRPRPGRASAAAFTLAALVAIAGRAAAADPTEDDPILKFAKDNGFEGISLAENCSSVSDGGDTLNGDGASSLPVGGGRRLECSIDLVPQQIVEPIKDSNDQLWCWLGQLTSFVPRALDDRLTVSVESAPSAGPWLVTGTHAGEEITVIRASGVWPLGVGRFYSTIDLQPAEGQTCLGAFGL